MQDTLNAYPNLSIRAAAVQDIVLSDPVEGDLTGGRKVVGLRIESGEVIPCQSVVIATGTFLGGELHIGASPPSPFLPSTHSFSSLAGLETIPFKGRINEASAHSLSDSLREAGFSLGRLKTGTPPRLAKDSIKYEGLGEQKGDVPAKPFSFLTDKVANEVRIISRFLDAFEGSMSLTMLFSSRTIKSRASRLLPTLLRMLSSKLTSTSQYMFGKPLKVRYFRLLPIKSMRLR